ncbi:hypothetical protein Lsai_1396 [Legionella sainthelensi]|uniref:Transmembrane protein n=1 Tax=Legionella sainthelensi TaxID=28087 RepID=A0A0W0YPL7_9GAMM|nr:hypothetical protein [Legionella sainthelensi]KTD58789.1 hypothetical protein Lsai_1396 [Legionella sainthelensi]VEH34167.1 Uncharacterised protein [Legionella sainthelensi]
MWSNLISGFFGAVFAVVTTYWLQEYSKRKEHKRNINALLLSIKTEITVLQERFNNSFGTIKQIDGPIMSYYFIEQNYFLVLEGQAPLLGTIIDENLRALIIKTYIHVKSLIDSFKTNNITLAKYEDINSFILQNPLNPCAQEVKEKYELVLDGYAESIRVLLQETESNIICLFSLIDKYLRKQSIVCFKCGGRKSTLM